MKRIILFLLGPFAKIVVRFLHKCRNRRLFLLDAERYFKFSGAFNKSAKENQIAEICMRYHVLEKGLTMPNRHLSFGVDIMRSLIQKLEEYEALYGLDNDQVLHGAGIVKEYYTLHMNSNFDFHSDEGYWRKIKGYVDAHSEIERCPQIHVAKNDFYGNSTSSFGLFARSRHCVRHYTNDSVSDKLIANAVELANTAPSACNRQHTRVHCISDRKLTHRILELQGGCRGFGHLADKVLIITGDLLDADTKFEIHDIFVNGGIFLMQLCNALYFYQIAYCILTWSVDPSKDMRLRNMVDIPNNETVVAMVCIGNAPDEFDVASSPRRPAKDILFIH